MGNGSRWDIPKITQGPLLMTDKTRKKLQWLVPMMVGIATLLFMGWNVAKQPARAFVREEIESSVKVRDLCKVDSVTDVRLRALESSSSKQQAILERLDERTLWIKDRLSEDRK
jgi:hypothetical protein